MVGNSNIYPGMDYGLDPDYGSDFSVPTDPGYGNFIGYRTPASTIGLATDVRTANQIKATSDKLSTGAKIIEVSAISPDVLESIPDEHLREIKRMKDLVGAELTFHGPLIEATGFTDRGWDEFNREQAERQLTSAVLRSHELDPDGNINVTLHTTTKLPEMKTRIIEGGKEKVTEMLAIDERTGSIQTVKPKTIHITGEKPTAEDELKKMNADNWSRTISHASFNANLGHGEITGERRNDEKMKEALGGTSPLDIYKMSKTEEGKKAINSFNPEAKKIAESIVHDKTHGEVYIKDAYNEVRNLFDQAWEAAQKSDNKGDINKLESYRNEVKHIVNDYQKMGKLPTEKLPEFAEAVIHGVDMLNTLSEPPQVFREMNEFAVDKASDTYSNVAFSAFKKYEDTAPVISLENPPSGGGLSRAEDMKELIEASRKKFEKRAVEELGLTQKQAEKQSEKLIGATWDVGHINMLRKYGYEDEHLKEQAKTIAPYVKHVHLSDNFGYEHTELPMGMGNVPTKDHLEAIGKYNKEVKKIIEAGNWYQHFQLTPFSETLEAFGSPIYSMKMAPYWNQVADVTGSYFSGQGRSLPDQHFSMYGAGFVGLPTELGGQIQGQQRLSGTPME